MHLSLDKLKKVKTIYSDLFIIAVIFISTRILLAHLGMSFDVSYLGKWWQVLDPVLLKNDLLNSLLYLHSQPPLFNLIIGVVLKIFPNSYTVFFNIAYFLMSFFFAIILYLSLIKIGIRRWLSVAVTVVFTMSPSVILFENFFFYDFLVLFLLMLSFITLQSLVKSVSYKKLFCFFLILSVLALTRSLFHLLWFLVIVAMIVLFYRFEWKKVILAALIPFLLIVVWYGKNYYMFNNFGASSWMGMGLYKVTAFLLEDSDREKLYDEGVVSEYGLTMPFSIDINKVDIPDFESKTGEMHAAISKQKKDNGNKNYNYYGYLTVSDKLMNDFKSILSKRPKIYLNGILGTSIIYFAPGSNYLESKFDSVYHNYELIKGLDRGYGMFYYGQPLKYGGDGLLEYMSSKLNVSKTVAWRVASVGVLIILMLSISILYGTVIVIKSWRNKQLFKDRNNLVILFLLFNIVYVTAVGILCEAGENQRHRFMIEPFYLILVALLIEKKANKQTLSDIKVMLSTPSKLCTKICSRLKKKK